MKTDRITQIAEILRKHEDSLIAIRFRIGELIAEEVEASTIPTSSCCDTIAGLVYDQEGLVRAGPWYYDCYLFHVRFSNEQKQLALRNPRMTQTWLRYAVHQKGPEQRAKVWEKITLVTKDFRIPAPGKKKQQQVEARHTSGPIVLTKPIELEQVENVIAAIYADSIMSLEFTPVDVDKAIEEGRRRAGV